MQSIWQLLNNYCSQVVVIVLVSLTTTSTGLVFQAVKIRMWVTEQPNPSDPNCLFWLLLFMVFIKWRKSPCLRSGCVFFHFIYLFILSTLFPQKTCLLDYYFYRLLYFVGGQKFSKSTAQIMTWLSRHVAFNTSFLFLVGGVNHSALWPPVIALCNLEELKL